MPTNTVRIATIALLLATPAAADPMPEQGFDCVMEPQQTVKLATEAVGVLAQLLVDRGDVVRKGQVLGKLDDSVEAADLALARVRATNDHEMAGAQSRLAFLKRKYGRANQLVGDNIVSRATTDEAESDMNVAESQLRIAELNMSIAQLQVNEAQATLQRRSIVSPVDGIVTERLLQPGEYRNDQSPILSLAQIDPLRIETFVPVAYFSRIHPGMKADVLPQLPDAKPLRATTAIVDRVMDAASGTFGVRLAMPNPDLSLPVGVKCHVRFLPD